MKGWVFVLMGEREGGGGSSSSFENNWSETIASNQRVSLSLLTRIIVDARDVDPNPSRSWPPVSRQCVKVSREGCTSGDRVGIHARSPVLCAPVKVTVVVTFHYL